MSPKLKITLVRVHSDEGENVKIGLLGQLRYFVEA